MTEQIYPRLIIDTGHLRENAALVSGNCAARGIRVMGIVKGFNGIPRLAEELVRGGCVSLGTSRTGQIAELRAAGFGEQPGGSLPAGADADGKPGGSQWRTPEKRESDVAAEIPADRSPGRHAVRTDCGTDCNVEYQGGAGMSVPLWLIRIPMMSDAGEVVRLADGSLNSDITVLRALDRAARDQGKIHKVILMSDLGDLREGFWGEEALTDASLTVERELTGLKLEGIGTNLGCYGSVMATRGKMEELVSRAEAVEAAIGRRLDVISGGATSSYMRVLDGTMPERVNQLRIGEGIISARDTGDLHGMDMGPMHRDAFMLETEVVEVADKPTYPVGELSVDAFGHKQIYTDRGVRRHAIIAVGKVDYGDPGEIIPEMPGVAVLGASSDHTLLDIQDAQDHGNEIRAGDILRFRLTYAATVFLTHSPDVRLIIT